MEDIEDIIQDNTIIDFTKDIVQNTFSSEKEYLNKYNTLKKKYKVCPNKPTLRKTYAYLLKHKKVDKNTSFMKYMIKKKGRSLSGVTVITILTSPTPEYVNSKGETVKQKFSCGHNCLYCPNEPEIKINLKVSNVFENKKRIDVTTQNDIQLIRLLSYVIYLDKNYTVNHCSDFTNNSFSIHFLNTFPNFTIGDDLIGVKSEQPRSYLSTEPAVLRANRNHFDPILQIYDRTDALLNCGHNVDKIEILVLGGTWDNYPLDYQTSFIRDIYYSINSIDERYSEKLSLKEEIKNAQTSSKRIIGLTLETRPDYINLKQIKRLREFNVTRLQIGVQHIHNDVLDYIERGCHLKDIIQGNNQWKQNGGKIDWHLMPDLPGSSIEKDMDMFQKLFQVNKITQIDHNHFYYELEYPELQADQLKIYPCSTVDWTTIKEWYENGTYKPYSEKEEDLIKVIAYIKNNIFPWIRLNRIIRDIPNLNIIGGNKNVNLRQTLLNREDIDCQCIRCREVKGNTKNIEEAELFIRQYNAVQATEYFISFESPDQKILYGFLRLRINFTNDNLIYKELYDCSFIRELHVYGKVLEHNTKNTDNLVQHTGFGKRLLQVAENISRENGIHKVAIISGVGVREYYIKNGYNLIKNYMIKELKPSFNYLECLFAILLSILLFVLLYDFNYLSYP
tara:strand:+ start:1226 stop:3253 length:2028 start_codon:yes stop_codon:yes gene_type:complete